MFEFEAYVQAVENTVSQRVVSCSEHRAKGEVCYQEGVYSKNREIWPFILSGASEERDWERLGGNLA